MLFDLDKTGKHYLKIANEKIVEHDFKTAYENLITGFDSLICDCPLHIRKTKGLEETLREFQTFNCTTDELNFIQAYIYWQNKKHEFALKHINNYIEHRKNEEIGYYLHGRISAGMKNYTIALDSYYKSLERNKTNRTLYRIGQTKEEIFNKNGIAELYEATLSNVISHCCGVLAQNSKKRGILLPESNSFFVNSFNKGGNLLYLYSEQPTKLIILKDGTALDFLEEKSKFLTVLKINKKLFLNSTTHLPLSERQRKHRKWKLRNRPD